MALRGILSTAEILMTPDPFAPQETGPWPIVWLSSHSGSGTTEATLRTGLNLDSMKLGPQGVFVRQIKHEVRIEVLPDPAMVMRWLDWAAANGTASSVIRTMSKWPLRPEWWWVCQSEIPSGWWVDISVRDREGTFVSMLDPQAEVIESDPNPEAEVEDEPSLAERIRRLFRG